MSIIVRFLRWLLRLFGLGKPSVETITVPHQGQAPPPPATELDLSALPYLKTYSILKRSELDFYRVLRRVVGQQAIICPKVRLADIFYVPEPERDEFPVYFYKITSKHVDFLLCSPRNLRPLVGIELDDPSHRIPERQERDAFVNAVFATADLPLLRIPTQTVYVPEELRAQVAPYLTTQQPQAAPPPPSSQPAPTCPKCGKPMTRLMAKQGRYIGQMFWGCTGFPDCKTRLPYVEDQVE